MDIFSFFKSKPRLPPLRFYNTLSGVVETFVPLGRKVKMYNCGPTVYDRQHIGNLRPYVFADTLRQTLLWWGYPVEQVVNITDVGHLTSDADEGEDKLEMSARTSGRRTQDIAREITQRWFEDLEALGIERSNVRFPKATDYIGEQIALVKTLEEKGYAYRTKDGVYFDTTKFGGYGKLGSIDLVGLREGARVKENPEKRNPHDFALWKLSKKGERRQQEWKSPWGTGFPGWHVECTAMIFTLLGRQIDIHTGGVDHIPIHHNNEIAQAEGATGKTYVRYWLHNEFITIEGKKIAKSLGNTVYLSQLTDRGLSPRALRYWYLTGHYRTPMNFTWEAIEGANQALMRLSRFFFEELPKQGGKADENFMNDFTRALADDLDTPKALARIWELIKDTSVSPAEKYTSLREADKILGLGFSEQKPLYKLAVVPRSELPEPIGQLVAEREVARAGRDFTRADALREELRTLGYTIEDTAQGPKISKN